MNKVAEKNNINKIINVTLCVILFIVPLLITPRKVYSIPYNILKICVLLLCGLTLLICLILKRKELKFDLIDKTLLAFYALIILSTIFSINISKSIIGERNRYEGILTFTTYFLTYYCAKYYFSYNKKLKYFAIAVVLISSVIGILQYYNIFPLYYIFNIPFEPAFASSTFGNRNFFGSFLSICVPIFMALYIIKRKKVYLITSLISFWAMLVSMTRSSWIGLAVATIFGLIFIIKNFNKEILKRTIHIVIDFTIIFIFVLIPPPFIADYIDVNTLNGRLSSLGKDFGALLGSDTEKGDLGSGRIRIWTLTLKEIASSPLLGTGPDTLVDGLNKNVRNEHIQFMLDTHQYIDKAHNEYLQIAATIGIPAMIVYLAFLAQILGSQKKQIFKDNSTFILIIPIISYIVQAFFNISTIGVAPVFWALLGLVQNQTFKNGLHCNENKLLDEK